ncbi:MAG: hypothetical protein CLLPBCKN_008400 [Chroococcidiopsis cubana SAG 39.79]|nr:hypothetical protein [Chroococcidiopsis cubana]MDZ4878962.1 hypothetical protein [Chroococcidiopsis cubana SAG 39.79]
MQGRNKTTTTKEITEIINKSTFSIQRRDKAKTRPLKITAAIAQPRAGEGKRLESAIASKAPSKPLKAAPVKTSHRAKLGRLVIGGE